MLKIELQNIFSSNVRAEEVLIAKSVSDRERASWISKTILSSHRISEISWHMERLLLPKVHHTWHLKGLIVIVDECIDLLLAIV